ncbi:unnamed protein product [Ambrosiozyma monospora]|uniref:Unnamed protein product n=1 Tax=Ambrosiozyma monospora TaxID=43982 RepID=A0ACB5TAP0_AMBMO|nr:unnamed protein product [Ambrosiozyma monospora]
MMVETINNVYGRTVNPFNRKLSCGGSSGGAAVNAALGGDVISIGSDIGGSIRIPSAYQHLYGLCPTFGRFPAYGTRSALPGLEAIHLVSGPLCRSLDSMEFYLENILAADPSTIDPMCSYLPWKPIDLSGEKLTFAICLDDGFVRPVPPVRRALKTVKKLIEDAGHEVIEWQPKDLLRDLTVLSLKLFFAEGAETIKKTIKASGEPFLSQFELFHLKELEPITVSELYQAQEEKAKMLKQFLDEWMATKKLTKNGKVIDAFILPVAPYPAPPHNKAGWFGYTTAFNVLGWPAGVLPVTYADKNVDIVEKNYEPRNPFDKQIYDNYDPVESDGCPVSIQVSAKRFEEEKIVAVLKVLSKLLQDSQK